VGLHRPADRRRRGRHGAADAGPRRATVLGAAGPMALRIPMAAASGAGIGVADALARGNSPLVGAGVGGAAGALGPVVGKAAGAGRNRVAEALTKVPDELNGISRGARQALVDTQSPNTAARLAELGPEGMLFEGNPGTFQLAQGWSRRDLVRRRQRSSTRSLIATPAQRAAQERRREAISGRTRSRARSRSASSEEMEQASKGYAAPRSTGSQQKPRRTRRSSSSSTRRSRARPARRKRRCRKQREYFYGPERSIAEHGRRPIRAS
jgi:hypothetical protein